MRRQPFTSRPRPLSPRSQCLGTVRVGGRTSELDAGAGPGTSPASGSPIRQTGCWSCSRSTAIVDQRHIVRCRLLDFDRVHGTDHLRGVEGQTSTRMPGPRTLPHRRDLAAMVGQDALDWYREQPSSPQHAPDTERPHPGALEMTSLWKPVARWSTATRENTPDAHRTEAAARAETVESENLTGVPGAV